MDECLLRRARFTVLDRCPSPLLLCEAYAAQNGLRILAETADLTTTSRAFPANLIVVHHLLPFLPEAEIPGALERLRSWLKENGRVGLCTMLRRQPTAGQTVS